MAAVTSLFTQEEGFELGLNKSRLIQEGKILVLMVMRLVCGLRKTRTYTVQTQGFPALERGFAQFRIRYDNKNTKYAVNHLHEHFASYLGRTRTSGLVRIVWKPRFV